MSRSFKRVGLGLAAFITAFVVVLAVAGATYSPNLNIPAGVPGKHLDVLGTPIRIVQRGAGRDILFIHGSPGSVEDGRPITDPLSQNYRVTAFDRPGNGYSGDSGKYSLEHNADVALGVIHALGLKRVVVVGHSYGGATALALALRNDADVSAYVILDSAVYKPGRPPDFILRTIHVPVLGMGFARVLGSQVAPEKIRAGLLQQFPGTPPPEEFLAERIALWNQPKVTHTIAEETLGAAEYLSAQSPRYGTIQRPVFIVAQADSEPRRQSAQRLHDDVHGSSLELLSGTGHYVQFEKATEVVATVRKAAETP